MARPQKSGLDYFPLDCDFFQNEKIICLSAEFGPIGELAAIRMMMTVYSKGYFARWDEMLKFKLARDLAVTPEQIDTFLDRMIKWELFDADLFHTHSVLTSAGIQERYFLAVKRRKLRTDDLPYLLIDLPEQKSPSKSSGEINVDINPQSKVKDKVNEIKENQTKPTLSLSSPLPSPEVSQTQEEERVEEVKIKRIEMKEASYKDNYVTFLDEFLAATPASVLDRYNSALGIDRERFVAVARAVVDEWQMTGATHPSFAEASRHLLNHCRCKLKADPRAGIARSRSDDDYQRRRRQEYREKSGQQEREYRASVQATGLNGWQQYCKARGIDPTASAADVARRMAQVS